METLEKFNAIMALNTEILQTLLYKINLIETMVAFNMVALVVLTIFVLLIYRKGETK